MGTPICHYVKQDRPRPKQCKHVKVTVQDKNDKNQGSLPPKFRASLTNDSCESGDVLLCKFSQHHVDWRRVDTRKDHLGSKAQVKNKEKHCAAHPLLGEICEKGQRLKWKK